MDVEIWPQRGPVPKVSDCSPCPPGQISSISGFRLTCVRFAAGELVRVQAGKVGGQSPELWSRGATGNHGGWVRGEGRLLSAKTSVTSALSLTMIF